MNAQPTISQDAFSEIEGAFHREIRGLLSKKLQAKVMGKFREVLATKMPSAVMPDVDLLAQEIRRVDGKHDLGAGALAEALQPFLQAQGLSTVTADMVRHADHSCPSELSFCDKWDWKARHIRQSMLNQEFLQTSAFLRREPGA